MEHNNGFQSSEVTHDVAYIVLYVEFGDKNANEMWRSGRAVMHTAFE